LVLDRQEINQIKANLFNLQLHSAKRNNRSRKQYGRKGDRYGYNNATDILIFGFGSQVHANQENGHVEKAGDGEFFGV
jgi:hypothetical protein